MFDRRGKTAVGNNFLRNVAAELLAGCSWTAVSALKSSPHSSSITRECRSFEKEWQMVPENEAVAGTVSSLQRQRVREHEGSKLGAGSFRAGEKGCETNRRGAVLKTYSLSKEILEFNTKVTHRDAFSSGEGCSKAVRISEVPCCSGFLKPPLVHVMHQNISLSYIDGRGYFVVV